MQTSEIKLEVRFRMKPLGYRILAHAVQRALRGEAVDEAIVGRQVMRCAEITVCPASVAA